MLRVTGVAGRPLEHFEVLRHSGRPRQPREYFHGVEDAAVLDRLAPLREPIAEHETAEAWWRRILADGTTANGVWGGKLMWGHVADLLARAGELAGLGDASLETVLRTLLGDVTIVHVTRPDAVAQAVSLWRAVQTESWRSEDGDGAESGAPAYVFSGIDHLRHRLEEDDAAWRRWFAATGRTVHEVRYDELSADPRGTVERVLGALGLPDGEVPQPDMLRQSDERSAAGARRYRAERRSAA